MMSYHPIPEQVCLWRELANQGIPVLRAAGCAKFGDPLEYLHHPLNPELHPKRCGPVGNDHVCQVYHCGVQLNSCQFLHPKIFFSQSSIFEEVIPGLQPVCLCVLAIPIANIIQQGTPQWHPHLHDRRRKVMP